MSQASSQAQSPATSSPETAPAEQPHGKATRHGILAFLKWLFTGFGLLGLLARKSHVKIEDVVVYTVPKSFYLWAVMLTGFIACRLLRHYPDSAVLLGWIYIWVLMYTLVTLLFDLGSLRILLWTGALVCVWIICKYIEDYRHIHLLSHFFGYFRALHPAMDYGFVTVLSWFMLILWIGGAFQAFARGRKRFTPNGIEEWYFGEGCEITDRSGLHFVTRYPDVFESFLGFGSGSIHAIDGTGRIVKRWDNILFLFFIWGRVEEIIEQRAATVDNADQEPAKADQAAQ